MSDGTTIFVTAEGNWDFEVEDVWPDGDAPEHVTAEAIREVLEKDRSWLDDLRRDVSISIDVTVPNPAWRGDNVLPGFDVPPRVLRSSSEIAP